MEYPTKDILSDVPQLHSLLVGETISITRLIDRLQPSHLLVIAHGHAGLLYKYAEQLGVSESSEWMPVLVATPQESL